MSGSSQLTPEQQDWYANKFGVRYLAVAEQPYRPSRRLRRGRAKDQQDIDVLYRQQDVEKLLRKVNIAKAFKGK